MVADGSDSSLWPTFFYIESPLLRKASYFPALGNHERNDSYFYEFFSPRAYYSFNWGNAHFAVMDSDLPNVAPDAPRAMPSGLPKPAGWKTTWQIARRPSSASSWPTIRRSRPLHAGKEDNPHMTALMPLFEKYKVTAGLFGHDHNYQHYLRNGIHYFISGGGGAPLYDVNTASRGHHARRW